MSKTRHMHQRMNQRGITSEIINLVKDFGDEQGDKLYINKKRAQDLLKEFRKICQELQRIESKGGVVLVNHNNLEITTYNLNSYKRNTKN